MIPGVGDYLAADEANEANSAMAQKQMDFQKEMSSTSYQRATEDMRKAGINPMLAYQQGGASTPAGAMATMQPKNASRITSSALEYMNLKKELENKDSMINLNRAAEGVKRTEQKLNEYNAKALKARLPAIEQGARTDAKIQKINETMAIPDAVGSRVATGASAVGNVFGGIGRMVKGLFGNSAKGTKPSVNKKMNDAYKYTYGEEYNYKGD